MKRILLPLVLAFPLVCGAQATSFSAPPSPDPIRLSVNASEAPRRLIHIQEDMPVSPGPLTLLYPEWIPGEHGPTGPIADLVALKIRAGEQVLQWKRDDVNLYAFHITVPAGVSSLSIIFDFISPPEAGGFTSGASITTELAVLSWNQFLLYPQGIAADQLRYQATLRLPDGWHYGTALPVARETRGEIEFRPVALNMLIDSPLSAGSHYRTIDLGKENNAPHFLHLAADSDRALDITQEQVQHYQDLVAEAGALFGSRHYRDYHFLLTLSDHVASFGLEHHESSDDRVPERTLLDEGPRLLAADLLPHEFVHSWNGKYRRPIGLITKDYSEPMRGDLLWVYEGMTQYLGYVLAARTGLLTREQFRERLASIAASYDRQSGRSWRSLEDTAVAAQVLYYARDDYSSLRRGVDFYDEAALLWLEVDVLIRQLSRGHKSLDDFCKSFEGGPGGAPAVKPYNLEELETALNAVQPYDWAEFFRTRVQSVAAPSPLGGIERAGWRLAFNSVRSDLWNADEEDRKSANLMYSLGMTVRNDGAIADVAVGGPAFRAGLAPNNRITTVNHRDFSVTVLRDAIQAAGASPDPLEIEVKSGEYVKTHSVDYHGGEKYPHLERDGSLPDLLAPITESKRR